MTTYPELCQSSDHVATAVLNQRTRDHLECVGDSLVGRALNALESLCLVCERDRDCHLCCAATRRQRRVEHDVPCDGHGVCEVAIDLVQDVLGRTTEEDGARFRVGAFCEE